MGDEDILNLLINTKQWTPEDEVTLNDKLPKHVEYWKEELCKAAFRTNDRDRIRKYLAAARNELNRLYAIRHAYDHSSCYGVATYAKTQFIVESSTFYPDNKQYNWDDESSYLAMIFFQENQINEDSIRELSHTSPWDCVWASGRKTGKLFDEAAINLSADQQRLIMWSSMYDSIHEHQDCPDESIINDNDMIDGWLSIKRKQREDAQNRVSVDNMLTNERISKADEVYIPAQEREDASKIDRLNSAQALAIKKQRLNVIKAKGEVNEAALPDIKQKLDMQLANQYSKTMKGN